MMINEFKGKVKVKEVNRGQTVARETFAKWGKSEKRKKESKSERWNSKNNDQRSDSRWENESGKRLRRSANVTQCLSILSVRDDNNALPCLNVSKQSKRIFWDDPQYILCPICHLSPSILEKLTRPFFLFYYYVFGQTHPRCWRPVSFPMWVEMSSGGLIRMITMIMSWCL